MAHLTADLAAVEENIGDVVDLDASWSYKPSDIDGAETVSSMASAIQTELLFEGEMLYDFESTLVRSETDTPPSKEITPSLRTGSTTSIAVEEMQTSRNGSNPKLSNESDDSRIHRGLDEGVNKWSGALRHVLTVDPKSFAMDLTRVQWQLFIAIRVSVVAEVQT